jgi:hypothetical protein
VHVARRKTGPGSQQLRGHGGGGDRSGENRGVGWCAWATRGECGLVGQEGKWAGPERKQCRFLN